MYSFYCKHEAGVKKKKKSPAYIVRRIYFNNSHLLASIDTAYTV